MKRLYPIRYFFSAIACLLLFNKANAQPCTPSTTNGCSNGDNLAYFSLKGESSTVIYNLTGATCSSSPLAYSDFTSSFTAVNLARGKTYSGFMLTGNANDYATVWIDFNDNNVFEITERLMNNLKIGTANLLYNLYIPLSATTGNHRLRVRIISSTATPTQTTDPCTNYANSETEDYPVNIVTSGSTYTVATGTLGSCTIATNITIDTESNNNGTALVNIVDSTNATFIGLYPDNNDFGTTTASLFKNNGPLRQECGDRYYLDRNISLSISQGLYNAYRARLFYRSSELNALIAQPGSGVTSQFDLVATNAKATCATAGFLSTTTDAVNFPTGFGSISGDRFVDLTNITKLSTNTFYLHGGSSPIGTIGTTCHFDFYVISSITSPFSFNVGSISAEKSFSIASYAFFQTTITAPSGFQVSLTSGSGFANSVQLTGSGTIYVRVSASATGNIAGNIVVTLPSAGIDDKYWVKAIANPSTTWDGSTWSNGVPSNTVDAIIASSTTPASFTCMALTINNGVALSTTGITATVNGNIINNGNGIAGTGGLTIAASSTLSGNAISFSGKLTVNSGATLTTAGLLTIASDATNTGYVANSAGTISGNVIVQRFIPSGRRVYRFLSHPFTTNLAMSSLTDNIDITGSGGSPFTTTSTNSPSAFSYDNSIANSSSGTDPGWTALTASSTLNAKTAYRILVRGSKGQTGSLNGGSYTPDPVTLDWTGALNQGDQIITLTNNGANKAYNFVGNPYASPVDLSLVTRGSNINANFSVWDPNANTKGAYTTQAFSSSYILPSGSAFFTQTSANTNNTITFTEASKSTGTPTSLFRTTTTPEDKLILEVHTANGNYADKLAFYLDNKNSNYTANNDVLWDAEKMVNPDANFYSFSKDGKKLAIDRRPLKDNDTIQLGFTNTSIANFILTVKELPTINTNYDLYLRDKWLNTTNILKANTSINVELTNDAASQGNNRFDLITKLNKNQPVLNSKLVVRIYPNPASEKINIVYEGLNDKETTTIKIMDASGRMVQTIDAGKVAFGNKIINTKLWGIGMYSFELINGTDTQTQQIIKQ